MRVTKNQVVISGRVSGAIQAILPDRCMVRIKKPVRCWCGIKKRSKPVRCWCGIKKRSKPVRCWCGIKKRSKPVRCWCGIKKDTASFKDDLI
jgi:hypothetical protein